MLSILTSTKPDITKVPGGWEPKTVPHLDPSTEIRQRTNGVDSSYVVLENVLSAEDCNALIAFMNRSTELEPVSIQGKLKIENELPGSMRTTVWSAELANQLWAKLRTHIPNRTMHQASLTDWWQGDLERRKWEPVACTPLLRFMKYFPMGHHYPHYDAGYIYPDDNYRTLMSMVIYLTTSSRGGATRFIEDRQNIKPVWERDHDDWMREAQGTEVLFRSEATQGNVLLFDHRICHDVEKNLDLSERIIIRGDILFKATPT